LRTGLTNIAFLADNTFARRTLLAPRPDNGFTWQTALALRANNRLSGITLIPLQPWLASGSRNAFTRQSPLALQPDDPVTTWLPITAGNSWFASRSGRTRLSHDSDATFSLWSLRTRLASGTDRTIVKVN
jgi:hypothetical protein